MYLEKQYITAEFLPKSNRSSKYEMAIHVFLTKEANTANSYSTHIYSSYKQNRMCTKRKSRTTEKMDWNRKWFIKGCEG